MQLMVIINAFPIRYHWAIISEISLNLSLHYCYCNKLQRSILPLWLIMMNINAQLIVFALIIAFNDITLKTSLDYLMIAHDKFLCTIYFLCMIVYYCAIISDITLNKSLHYSNSIQLLRTILPLWLLMMNINAQLVFLAIIIAFNCAIISVITLNTSYIILTVLNYYEQFFHLH